MSSAGCWQRHKPVKEHRVNGTPATVSVKSSTYLTAVVPSGATSGFVQVTTSKGTLTSNKKFQVHA